MFNNIAFSGGGTRTLAFLGCIKYLEEHEQIKDVKNVIGASAGSIIALLVVINWTYKDIYDFSLNELCQFVENLKFPLSSVFTLSKSFGMNDGKDVVKLVESILLKSNLDPAITFLDLAKKFGKNIIIAATNLTGKQIEYLSVDTYPEMHLSTAIRMSTAVPVLFTPVKYYEDLYVDSMIYNNFPVNFFEHFKINTLGMNLLTVSNTSTKPSCFSDYLYLLYTAFCDSIYKTKNINDYHFVCNVDVPTSLTNFDFYKLKFILGKTQLDELIDIGYESMTTFYKNVT